MLSKEKGKLVTIVYYIIQWVAEGTIFFDPSVGQSVRHSVRQSWFFFVSATPLKPVKFCNYEGHFV